MMHIKESLLRIGKSSLCGGSGFPLSLFEWSFTICRSGGGGGGVILQESEESPKLRRQTKRNKLSWDSDPVGVVVCTVMSDMWNHQMKIGCIASKHWYHVKCGDEEPDTCYLII